ncbi:MAG: prolyl oligopeptidase family serine peptidase [bacterium]
MTLPIRILWLCALLSCVHAADAQVVVHLKDGGKLIGEAVLKDGDASLELKICHSHKLTIPKTAILKYESASATQAARPKAAPQPAPRALLSDQELARIETLILEFFGQPERRAQILAEIRREDALPRANVDQLSKSILRAARSAGPKLREGDFVFDHPTYRGNVHVELHPRPTNRTTTRTASGPAITQAAEEESYALVLLLHGGGEGEGRWQSGADMFIEPYRKALGRVIFLCPTVLEKHYAEWGKNPAEEDYVKELMKAAKRTWPIDTDRVYCAGYSMGGYGTWHYGGHQADVFAGLVSGAGGILLGMQRDETWGWGILSNLRHTAITFAHAKDDKPSPVWSDQAADRILKELSQQYGGGYVHRYTEYDKGGHNGASRDMSAAVTWSATHQRPRYPKAVVWEPSRSFIRHFYWLRDERPQFFTRVEAAIDGNTIDVKLTRLSGGFSILLNEHLVDMNKPVTVRCAGEQVFHGVVQPSLSAMIESIEDKLDERMWFWGRIDF